MLQKIEENNTENERKWKQDMIARRNAVAILEENLR